MLKSVQIMYIFKYFFVMFGMIECTGCCVLNYYMSNNVKWLWIGSRVMSGLDWDVHSIWICRLHFEKYVWNETIDWDVVKLDKSYVVVMSVMGCSHCDEIFFGILCHLCNHATVWKVYEVLSYGILVINFLLLQEAFVISKLIVGKLRRMSQASAMFDYRLTNKKVITCVLVLSSVEREWIRQFFCSWSRMFHVIEDWGLFVWSDYIMFDFIGT